VVRAAVSVALGGSVAEDAFALSRGVLLLDARTGRPFPIFSTGAEDDERAAQSLARHLYRGGPAQREFLRRMRSATERRLASGEAWRAVQAVAGALLRARSLPGDAVERIVRGAMRRPARRRGVR
jgi:hypothetical protein